MLKCKIAIYIPSTIDGNVPAPTDLIDKWVRASKVLMASLFGGFTTIKAEGGCVLPGHGLVEENVTIVQSFTDEEGLTKLCRVNELARDIAREMRQEMVSVESNGTLNFITA